VTRKAKKIERKVRESDKTVTRNRMNSGKENFILNYRREKRGKENRKKSAGKR